MRNIVLSLILCSSAFAFVSCKGKGKHPEGPAPGSSDASSNVNLSFQLAIANPFQLAGESLSTNCHVGLTPQIQVDGQCITPSKVSLWVTGVSLGTTDKLEGDAMQTAGARLLGGGSGFGKDGYFVGAAFDLANLTGIRGSDNLSSTYDKKYTFKSASIQIAYFKGAFEAGGRTWELLVPFVNQPVEGDSWLKDCFGEAWLSQAKTNAVVLPNMSFKTGDMLVCKRQDANTPCTADQFKWADSSTGALSSTRPASAKTLNSVSTLTRKCNTPANNGAPPDSRYDLPSMVAKLSTPVDLYGDLSHGPTSKSNPAEFPARSNAAEWGDRRAKNLDTAPFTVYFNSTNGTVTSGDRLDAQIKIDASNYIFLENLTNLDANTTDAEIIKAMTTKEFWAWEKLGIGKLGDSVMLGADLKVKVSKSATVDEIYAKPVDGAKATAVTPL